MNLKCPKCGGSVIYDVETDQMKCTYCNRLASIDEFSKEETPSSHHTEVNTSGFSLKLNTKDNEPNTTLKLKDTSTSTPALGLSEKTSFLTRRNPEKTASFSAEDTSVDYMDMHIYHCPSCGADLMVGSTQAATYCSYCGSPSIVYDRLSKEQKPSKIIPFKLSEDQALSCIRDRFGHGSYIPPEIRKLAVNDIHAIYIPFWLYTSFIRRHVILDTHTNDKHYIYKRDVSCTYENVTLDASLKLSNDMSRRLEPYNMNELEDFNVSYLSGYYADKYDVPYTALEGVARSRCQNFLRSEILQSCHYANDIDNIKNYTTSEDHEEYELLDVKYALLPAYFINIQYGDSSYLILVNGQTGKVVGNLPVEKRKYILRFIKNAVIACTIYSLLSMLFLLHPKLYICFIFPILIDSILMVNGIKNYKKYKLGMQQLASRHMTAYATRKEED